MMSPMESSAPTLTTSTRLRTDTSIAHAAQPARAIVFSLGIKERGALYAAYMPFLKNGGIFVPSQAPPPVGTEVHLLLTLGDDPIKLPVAGKVVWVTPAHTSGRQPGMGLQFPDDAHGVRVRNRIEDLLGPLLKAQKPTYTI